VQTDTQTPAKTIPARSMRAGNNSVEDLVRKRICTQSDDLIPWRIYEGETEGPKQPQQHASILPVWAELLHRRPNFPAAACKPAIQTNSSVEQAASQNACVHSWFSLRRAELVGSSPSVCLSSFASCAGYICRLEPLYFVALSRNISKVEEFSL